MTADLQTAFMFTLASIHSSFPPSGHHPHPYFTMYPPTNPLPFDLLTDIPSACCPSVPLSIDFLPSLPPSLYFLLFGAFILPSHLSFLRD